MPDHPPATPVQELVPLLRARDIARSVDFYCEKLAFKMTMSWAPDDKLEWCRLERDGAAVMLQQACDEDGSPEGWGRGVVFYFNCNDADAEHARLAACGLKLDPPKVAFYGMNQLYFKDPDGYELCFQNVVHKEQGAAAAVQDDRQDNLPQRVTAPGRSLRDALR